MARWFRRGARAPVPGGERKLTFAEGMALLPWRDRLFLYYVLFWAAVPALLTLLASAPAAADGSVLFALGSRPWLAGALALAAGTAGLLVWERPASRSLRAYLAQVRGRFLQIQAARADELRRRFSHSEEPTHDAPDP